MRHGHHTLVVMPTGSGKPLIYQLAAPQLPGVTLVVSPLIALMKDQVDSIMPFLAHWAFNFTGSASGIYDVPALLWLITGLWWVVAAAIMVLDRARFMPWRLLPHLRQMTMRR